jgi:hypothetical protein
MTMNTQMETSPENPYPNSGLPRENWERGFKGLNFIGYPGASSYQIYLEGKRAAKKLARGGSRKGAGRPSIPESDKAKNRTFKLNDADWLKFKLKGGAKWLRSIL